MPTKHPKHPCDNCGTLTENRRFCSRSCAATCTNKEHPKRNPNGVGGYSIVVCAECGVEFERRNAEIYQSERKGRKMFCSSSCAGKAAGRARRSSLEFVKTPKVCQQCGSHFFGPKRQQYCSPSCASKFNADKEYYCFIASWKEGEAESTKRGLAGQISNHIRRYLFEKYGSKCCECGWDKVNPSTGRTPLQVDHIDGDWRNDLEDNLRLLCPNCHSLTPTYCGLNRGAGRSGRYLK